MEDSGLHLFEEDSPETSSDAAKKELPKEIHIDPGSQKYMIFTLYNESFAVDIRAAREVIDFPKVRKIPNSKHFFCGFFNLRGEVIGLIDLRDKFASELEKSISRTVIVFECAAGPLGVVVDRIEKIMHINGSDIDTSSRINSTIPQNFVMGISKNPDINVLFIDVQKILDESDWIMIKSSG